MSLPKDPRGMMINLMYLVLTAMLALNITREVLTAFNTIDQSITRSNESIEGKNIDIYTVLDQMEQNPSEAEKVKPINNLAKQLKSYSDELSNYLDNWKDSVINVSGGYEIENGEQFIKKMDDINTPTMLLVKENGGDEVKARLEKYIDDVEALIPSADFKSFYRKNSPIQIIDFPKNDDNPQGRWAHGTFNNIPVIAAVTMFSKFQNDVRNSEAMVLEHLMTQIHADDYKFDGLEVIAVPNTTYALQGDEIEAKIMLAAYNKSANPSITSSAGPVTVQNGIGTLKMRANGVGERTVSGSVSIDKGGERETYPYSFKYMVGSAGASLQLDKMNVMYIGVDNPVTISASGYNIEDVAIAMPGGNFTKTGAGKYDVRVDKIAELEYTISAGKGGQRSTLEKGKIRTKYVPDPMATMLGQHSGSMNAGRAKSALGIIPELKDFVFDLRFEVVSFTFYWIDSEGETLVTGNQTGRFNDAVRGYMARSKAGDRWIMDNVKVMGPDKRERVINSITILLN